MRESSVCDVLQCHPRGGDVAVCGGVPRTHTDGGGGDEVDTQPLGGPHGRRGHHKRMEGNASEALLPLFINPFACLLVLLLPLFF